MKSKTSSVRRLFLATAVSAAIFGMVPLANASEVGVTDSEIVLGQASVQSGPAASLGTNMRIGAEALFKRVNAAGGVNGRKIKMISYDDKYEPAKTVELTNKLIDGDKVFGLFGYVGTPTAREALPITQKSGVPFLGALTGVEFLRNPLKQSVFNVRASYFQETEAMVERLVTDRGVKKIAMVIQDDAFGEAGKTGVERALSRRSMTMSAVGKYQRNTENVAEAFAAVKGSGADAIITVGTGKAIAAFVKQARGSGMTVPIFGISFMGVEDFIAAAGKEGEGMYVTQVVPSPEDASVSIVKKYQEDMKAAGATHRSYESLEGYISAAVMADGLKNAGKDVTRASFISALESTPIDLGGVRVAYSKTNHNGISDVFLTKVQGGKSVHITSLK